MLKRAGARWTVLRWTSARRASSVTVPWGVKVVADTEGSPQQLRPVDV